MMERMALDQDHQIRLSEVVCIISLATDLGTGVPMGHAARTCLLSLRVGRRLGLADPDLVDLYYMTLLRMLGCTADSAESAEYFFDEIEFGRQTQHLDYGDPEAFGRWVAESFASEKPAAERERMLAKLFSYSPERRRAYLAGHCEVAQMFATRLGMSAAVVEGLGHVFERWDGAGAPNQVGGEGTPLPARIMNVCNELEIHHRLSGAEGAAAMARSRAGGQFDPAVVDAALTDEGLFQELAPVSAWDAIVAAEPGRSRTLTLAGLEEAGRVIADFADLKSVFFTHHSSGVAELAAAAGRQVGLDPPALAELRVAALCHDLGRVTVSNAIWDKQGPLGDAEWEKVRLHPYYTERLLSRAPSLAGSARAAGGHHERLDGSGYHRGSPAVAQGGATRLLAAADAYHAMTEARAHRPALAPDEAAAEMRREVAAGRLDPSATGAVLAQAGSAPGRLRRPWPAGLTPREVDVLREIARGASIQAAAQALHISPKTADFHLQNVYSKAGVTTRAAATLFAIQNDLLVDAFD